MFEIEIAKNSNNLPAFVGFEELKAQISTMVSDYKGLVYTDENVADAKKDAASLRKMVKELEEKRKTLEKEYMKPFEEFKGQIKELTALINEPIQLIDGQVKAFEAARKMAKKAEIDEFIDLANKDLGINFPFDDKWLNAATSMKKVKEEILAIKEKAEKEIEGLKTIPDFSFEAVEAYKESLDLAAAMKVADNLRKMAEKKAEAEAAAKAAKAEPEIVVPEVPVVPVVPEVNIVSPTPAKVAEERKWYTLSVCVTKDEALKVIDFLTQNGIPYNK